MVRIGFVGTGLIAWAHGLGLQAMIDAAVIDASIEAVYDRSEKRSQGFAAALGARAVDDEAAVMAGCDAVWVCTPTAAHRGAADQALAAGRAVFCEKPLAPDLAAARHLVDAVSAAGVPSQCGLVLRSAPVFLALRDRVRSGTLGQPMTALLRDDQYFPIQGTYGSTWRADVAQAGGGCLIEHSIHDLDILRFCFGEVDVVAAHTANHAGHEGIEDLAMVTLSFASGLAANLTSVWHDILSRGSGRRMEVFCQEGLLWLDNDFRGPLHLETSAGAEVIDCPSPPWVDDLDLGQDEVGLAVRAYVEADRMFIDALTSGQEPEPSLGEALVAHQLVDAAYRSAHDGGAPITLR
jgi:myo-inositol 2-dehydrogenase/D-chiro-inositol 1-dehydrogenase